MSNAEKQGWILQVVPGPDESFGHYLSRFREANCLSHKTLGEELRVPRQIVSDWEVPSRRRIPNGVQLERLSQLVGIPPERLRQMFPAAPLHLQTRLCSVCYGEAPVHRVSWQRQGMDWCDRHQKLLLSACPVCGSGFRRPTLWNNEVCQGCGLRFDHMESSDFGEDIERC